MRANILWHQLEAGRQVEFALCIPRVHLLLYNFGCPASCRAPRASAGHGRQYQAILVSPSTHCLSIHCHRDPENRHYLSESTRCSAAEEGHYIDLAAAAVVASLLRLAAEVEAAARNGLLDSLAAGVDESSVDSRSEDTVQMSWRT
jgi:hypothetical protein